MQDHMYSQLCINGYKIHVKYKGYMKLHVSEVDHYLPQPTTS